MKCQSITIVAGKEGESGRETSTSVWKLNRESSKRVGRVGQVNIREGGGGEERQRRKPTYKVLYRFLYPVCFVLSLPAHVHILEFLTYLKDCIKKSAL